MAKTITASPLSLISDRDLDMPDSILVQRLAVGACEVERLTQLTVTTAAQALRIAIANGQVLEKLFTRHDGEFAEWLEGAMAKKPDGDPLITERTARNWRTLYRKRDALFPPDESEPACRSLTEAYIKIGILPEPEQSDRDPHTVQSQLRLSYHLPDGDPSTWPAADRRIFLTKAEPIVRAYEAAKALV